MIKYAFLFIMSLLIISCTSDDNGFVLGNENPTQPKVSVMNMDKTSADVSWTTSTDPEGGAIVYDVVIDGNTVARGLTTTTYTATGLSPAQTYTVRIFATDPDGNYSSGGAVFSTLQDGAPSVPVVSVNNITAGSATVSWTASTDPEGGAIKYNIILNDKQVVSGLTSLTYNLTSLVGGTQYIVKVEAVDPLNTKATGQASFATIANEPPTKPEVSVSNISVNGASISWTTSTDPEGTPVKYNVFLNDQSVLVETTNTSYVFTDLAGNKKYTGKVIAIDADGQAAVGEFSFSTLSTPPSVPVITFPKVFKQLVEVDWAGVIDPDGDAITYSIYVNGNEEISSYPDTKYIIGNGINTLTPGTTYSIKVIAKDSSGAQSENTASVTTASASQNLQVLSAILSPANPQETKGVMSFVFSETSLANSIVLNSITYTNIQTFNNTTIASINIDSQTEYNALKNASQKTGVVNYTLNGVNKTVSFTYTVDSVN